MQGRGVSPGDVVHSGRIRSTRKRSDWGGGVCDLREEGWRGAKRASVAAGAGAGGVQRPPKNMHASSVTAFASATWPCELARPRFRGPWWPLPRTLRAAGGTFPAARGEFEGFPGLSTAASSLTSILYRGHKGR